MATQRKLGRPADQRKALLRNQVTQLVWFGKIETTLARAKEVRSIAERLITLAIRECENNVEVKKEFNNDKGQTVTVTVTNDMPSKLHVRRIMMATLYDLQEVKKSDESKADFRERTKDNKHPIIEKLFREIGPKYKKRNAEKGCAGGYTRIIKKGPRRGDAAELVFLVLVLRREMQAAGRMARRFCVGERRKGFQRAEGPLAGSGTASQHPSLLATPQKEKPNLAWSAKRV